MSESELAQSPLDPAGQADIDRPAYERRDISLWAIGIFAASLLVLAIVAQFGLAALLNIFQGPDVNHEGLPQLLATAQPPPSSPRLQTDPARETQQFRQQEEQLLHSYGWEDKDAGVVRIPIERAMELITEDRIPARAGEVPAFGVFAVPELESSGGQQGGN